MTIVTELRLQVAVCVILAVCPIYTPFASSCNHGHIKLPYLKFLDSHLASLCHLHHLCVVCAIYIVDSTPPLLPPPRAPDTDGPLDGGQSGKSRSCKNSNSHSAWSFHFVCFILFLVPTGALKFDKRIASEHNCDSIRTYGAVFKKFQ